MVQNDHISILTQDDGKNDTMWQIFSFYKLKLSYAWVSFLLSIKNGFAKTTIFTKW